MADPKPRVIAETKHLRLMERGGWSYVERPVATGVVCIVPLTSEQEVVLIEQYRPPVDGRVIEFPAGLAGDVAGEESESLEEAARRELLEETGYGGGTWRQVATVTSSPGLTNETITMFVATGIEKQAAGGGDATEAITVHVVPLATVDTWLSTVAAANKFINAKVYAGLYLAQREVSAPRK